MRKLLIGIVVLGVAVVGCKSGGETMASGAASADKTYTLAINAKQGEVFNYDVDMTGALNMNTKMSMTADKVEGDNTTFRAKILSMSMNGQPAPAAATEAFAKMSIIEVMDKHGKMVSMKYEGMPGGASGPNEGAIKTASFPDHPVKVGDTWTAETDKVSATYKFLSVTQENGKDVANLEVTLGDNPQFKADGPGKFAVDLNSGMPVSMTMSGTTPGGKVTMSMKQSS